MTSKRLDLLDLCPACGIAVVYVREIDRYVHRDGSANRKCWVAAVRGETELSAWRCAS